MKKHVYNATSLAVVLEELEDEFGLSSAAFYDAHVAGDPLEEIPRFHRHAWASFYREFLAISEGEPFGEHAGRTLEYA